HPNVKLFITHGGKLSFQESAYHATPMLALPIFGDQEKNAEHIVHMEYGLSLVWEELTVQKIVEAINEIIDNPSEKHSLSFRFYQKVDTVSRTFRDQMESPLERAIFWTEYVIRHQGALSLRSPAVKVSWMRILMLDVLALIGVFSLICLYVISWILKKTGRLLQGNSSGKRKLE
ncbi:UDP-glucuronosyltransferase 2A1, partial [Halocaridina rubra]